MAVTAAEIVDRIVRFGRSDPDSTERFLGLKHDEHLVPEFQQQLERALDSYGKFAPIAYKTHCLQDDGVDLVLRLNSDNDEAAALIGFQIKAESDFLKPDLLKTLKTQYYDAMQIAGLQHYYLVLCVHEDRHKQRLGFIASAFKGAAKTSIIEPTVAEVFLSLGQERIDAYIKASLGSGDIIQRKAIASLQSLNRMTAALVVYLTVQTGIEHCDRIDRTLINNSVTLRALHQSLREDTAKRENAPRARTVRKRVSSKERALYSNFEEEIGRDIDSIEDRIVTVEGDSVTLISEQVAAIAALATDARVRYDYDADAITVYLFNLLGIYR